MTVINFGFFIVREKMIEIYKDKKNEWRFRIKAKNGRIIAVGESYKRKSSLMKCLKSIKKNLEVIKFI